MPPARGGAAHPAISPRRGPRPNRAIAAVNPMLNASFSKLSMVMLRVTSVWGASLSPTASKSSSRHPLSREALPQHNCLSLRQHRSHERIDRPLRVPPEVAASLERVDRFQHLLYADVSQSLLVVLQALDAAAKEDIIRHLFTGRNLQGTRVVGFKQPSREDSANDGLWRFHQHMAASREVVIYNRSHDEDVRVVRVHEAAPWFVIPADYRWFRNLAITQIIFDGMQDVGFESPPASCGSSQKLPGSIVPRRVGPHRRRIELIGASSNDHSSRGFALQAAGISSYQDIDPCLAAYC